MGKWAKYAKRHRKEWENEPQFKGWLRSKQDGTSFCRLCNSELRPHRADLLRHLNTSKHKVQASKVGNSHQTTLKTCGISVSSHSLKKKEIILSSYIACHSSIRSVDHLVDILNKFSDQNRSTTAAGPSSTNQDNFNLHKTKCSAIIKNVIAPSLFKDLVDDLGDSYYSIIVDESTDVSTEKLLCINIKYYSKKCNKIKLQFLTFLPVIKTTADDLYQAVSGFLSENTFNLKKIVSIGTDGASNMCAEHNSLYAFLKNRLGLKHLILVKCICHSLHLCSSKASEVFSDEIDFLLKETYNWFRNSSLRISKYKEIYDLINVSKKFTKFTQLSTTRWLSRYQAVEKILNQYLELETFFNINADKERCHTAKILSNAYKNKENKLILTFIKPILKQIFLLNTYFQRSNVDYFQAFTDINNLIWTFARQIIKPPLLNHINKNDLDALKSSMMFDRNYLELDKCDFGYEFSVEVEASHLSAEKVEHIKKKCKEFLKVLIQELIKRMPSHLNVFAQIKNISPKVILNPIRPKFFDLPLHYLPAEKIGDVELQYRQILSIQWEEIFEGNIPDNSVDFWQKAITLKNAADELLFEDLSLFAFTLLSLPSSNADVERSFSIMNIIKCKLRNKIMVSMLNAIMLTRAYFHVNSICCKQFEPTADMISRFTSKMYTNQKKSDNNNSPDECDDLVDIEEIIDLCNFE